MLILKKEPGKLTIREGLARLRQNPDDPELEEFKADLKRLGEILVPTFIEFNRALKNAKPIFPSAILVSEITKLNTPAIRALSQIAESQLRLIEAFQMPNYVAESLKALSIQINQMYEPLRLLGQSFAIYQTPKLFNELSKFHTDWVVPGFVVTEGIEEISPKEYASELVEEKKVLVTELALLEANKFEIENLSYYYYKASKTLIFKVTTLAAIPLYTKDGHSDIELLITIFLDFLSEEGKIIGEFRKVFIPIKKLIERLITAGKKDADMNWIKSTKSNFVNHKVPDILKDVIKISNFDRKKEGYHFQIRVAIPMPKLPS